MMAALREFVAGWEVFRDAALSAAWAGALLGPLGVWLVARNLVFLGAALSQAAGLGVALALWGRGRGLPMPPAGWAAAAAVLATGSVAGRALAGREARGRDSVLAVVYLGAAAAVVAVSARTAVDVHDVQALLFGSAVAVAPAQARAMALAGGALGALHLLLWRGFAAVVLDEAGARVRGLPVRALTAALGLAVALAVAVVTQVLGALPAFAFAVLPALAALALASTLAQALAAAVVVGAATGLIGYLLAFACRLPVGASQALVGLAIWVLAQGLRAARRRWRGR